MLARFFQAPKDSASLKVLLHQYLSLLQFELVVSREQFSSKLEDINTKVAKTLQQQNVSFPMGKHFCPQPPVQKTQDVKK